ncbi:hypothetical protein PDESU_05221 [Pontiella desulfatans]|uniref:ParB/Sulfiredoxin domain-containing protein n=1 Tax=Pontiella desulfatans TaxID=2750659 RepID=A0A6C2U9A6_PONDE|nr:hypothetical protein [Pontiella desulfatans]VGO16630.1 hypothetical protein PDESU_05221 [Pontiella desulfatans]
MSESFQVNGIDLPADVLKPLNARDNINTEKHRGYAKIRSTIANLALIEPFCVYRDGDEFFVLDGYLRLLACRELGYDVVPCILFDEKEAYTYNRMVNNLSGFQEIKMMRKSMESLDEQTIADTFGMKNIRYRLAPKLVEQLHPKVAQAFEQELIGKTTAYELGAVLPEHQPELLKTMRRVDDFSPTFVRALVLQTPQEKRNPERQTRSKPKADAKKKRQALTDRLQEAEEQYDFYTKLFRTYTADLLKMTLYVRKVITTPEIREYLEQHHSSALGEMTSIVMEAR